MISNKAAWLTAKKAKPLEVRPAPYTPAGENELVIRTRAVAVNPVDCFKQEAGDILYGWVKYPAILGNDAAGEVVEVGSGVDSKRFQVGDRVLAHAVGLDKRSNKSSECAFQEYVVVRSNLTTPIPDTMSFEEACVIPLGASTAACGMFMKDYLGLQYPNINSEPNGQTLLVWGGSTSVGCNAIQLAVGAGYNVIATASPKNFEYLKKLGAKEVFDYRSPTVVRDIIQSLETQTSAGALAIGAGSMIPCVEIVSAVKGLKFVAQASVAGKGKPPSSAKDIVSAIWSVVCESFVVLIKSKLNGVQTKFIWGSDVMVNNVGKAIYRDYLPVALEEGKYIAAPKPRVVGRGLECVQDGFDILMGGVSATKIVVSL
ncbi:zinc-binding dehydrogenase family superfamily [Colletotrichum truncatum]|uniref:Zinc-binding dehydrogenase family superfamily n=1 Tax=Colletotrichum truncatum TaxID=5467 RepID=A0ACC3YPH6_COLTU|nr:zinc-binding dehydrogenase family superfamily [Colletotrichum truncatum]KAF6784267.1 zinc-binding dehydrogenase family superfamily [Colletotrichum truncatum]